jgi:hypothetical protein
MINITPFFKISRVKIVDQKVSDDLNTIWIKASFDKRFISAPNAKPKALTFILIKQSL